MPINVGKIAWTNDHVASFVCFCLDLLRNHNAVVWPRADIRLSQYHSPITPNIEDSTPWMFGP